MKSIFIAFLVMSLTFCAPTKKVYNVEGMMCGVGCVKNISSIGIGKFIEMDFNKKITKKNAIAITEESCKKLLANPNTETYSYEIEE